MRHLLTDISGTPSTPVGRTVNVAHRGASAQAPENTLAAVRAALSLGADLVELDVQRSRDGALVVMHDTTLPRTTNVRLIFPGREPWRVADFSLDELKSLDAGSWKGSHFVGEAIPTLAEAIELVRGCGTGLLLDLKAPHLYPSIVSDLVTAIREVPDLLGGSPAVARLGVESRNVAAMKELKTQDPAIPVGLVGSPAIANLPILATWADQINPSHFAVDQRYLDQVHALGMHCLVWTVNRAPAMKRALRLGVDGVITNRPDAFGRVLRERRTLSVVRG